VRRPDDACRGRAKAPPGGGATCSANAEYNGRYNDYDVYVRSNQPDQTVTVTDAYGHSGSWHTDSSGYADVYFKSGGYTPGQQVSARIGHATCSAML
jgi:hypothetical protein